MGVDIRIEDVENRNGEFVGKIIVRSSNLKGVKVDKNDIFCIIDEIFILVVVVVFVEGKIIIDNVLELRVKESDRIKIIV